MKEYLQKVLIYLKQELPKKYRDCITIENDVFIISVYNSYDSFNDVYNELMIIISESICRVRIRQIDLKFTIWTPNQVRDFCILK